MSAAARLLSVRLQGFKSFAERTQVTFGPGISAIVGPNGSGKSNLADALRWALGEQGRALRSRKSEDVIWAGSERRSAVGMADVQLTLDNGDGLLPVAFEVVELGRRLYRSGENEYLLNRQRVRLRDLVDLLDSAHLAENAFLFIGQGMVDQALALRPEERRPLFEEVAGVRRHERRRRRAEEQLAESEANLARVEDVLAELRPQVRRLAAQAEQATSRVSAGEELLTALLAGAHARWHDAATRVESAAAGLTAGRAAVDAALSELSVFEVAGSAAAAALDERARSLVEVRAQADLARTALTAAQLEEGRHLSEAHALARDRERSELERAAAEADLAQQRRHLAEPVPERDLELEAALTDAERDLSGALSELAALRAADSARDQDVAAVRRAAGAREAEGERARRRLIEAEREAGLEIVRSVELDERVAQAQAEQTRAHEALTASATAESEAIQAREAAAMEWERAAATATTAAERVGLAASALAAARTRLESASAAIEDDRGSGFAARMRERGARRLDDGLVVDRAFSAAIDGALAGAGRAYLTTRDGLREHATERGIAVVVDDLLSGGAVVPPERDADLVAAFERRVTTLGGGFLRGAIRRDGPGAAVRLLARAVWVPDLDAALALQVDLPAGWVAVVRDGSAVVGEVTVRLGAVHGTLERRANHEQALEAARGLERTAQAATDEAETARALVANARQALDAARGAESAALGERRRAEEAERQTARHLEALVREAAWQKAQVQRLEADAERARAAIPEPTRASAPAVDQSEREAIRTWETRANELRARRDRLAQQLVQVDAARRHAERRRAAAEAAGTLDESRIAAVDFGAAALAERERTLGAEADLLVKRLAEARVRAAEAGATVAALVAADADERSRLGAAERASATARERLRTAEESSRASERRDLEARLGLEGLREQLLVEMAGLMPMSLVRLVEVSSEDQSTPSTKAGGRDREATSPTTEATEASDEDHAEALADALGAAGGRWASSARGVDAPSAGRLAGLRRRYHELGAPNPYAVQEHAAVRARSDDMEFQHRDLRQAIDQTRALIAELETMISEQFRSTFAALETRFDARFQQLFGGGFARLSLTDPADLASTGIDIVARPPGKKPQALAMLSGGERSLTAVALLFAMLEVRPVPFCVLDEVDAALDEANVGRFTEALTELAETTQFIVITHNRGTIEIADALYGVTVGDDSVSRVISLRLDEATELADQSRGAVAVGPGQGPA